MACVTAVYKCTTVTASQRPHITDINPSGSAASDLLAQVSGRLHLKYNSKFKTIIAWFSHLNNNLYCRANNELYSVFQLL